MNPIHPGKLIMLFIPSDKVFLHFQKLLEAANYNVVRTTTVQGAIQKIIEFSPDMIVDGSYSFEYPNFQSYILLNRTTINHSIPYIVYIEKIRLDLIQTGLALGIDNFLFAPLDDKLIVSKVKLLLKKVDKHQISDKIRFEKIFHTSPLGMLIGNSERLERGNPAFYKLSGLLKNSSIPKLEDLFEISHDPVILNKIRNCLKGLIEEYVVSDISFN
ncbi:MAG TPA: PAS domain-containing protein, partial [Draconibacterium sp.]|nr:PAS domain-containing protein [Draconibacterium sp.]